MAESLPRGGEQMVSRRWGIAERGRQELDFRVLVVWIVSPRAIELVDQHLPQPYRISKLYMAHLASGVISLADVSLQQERFIRQPVIIG